MQKAISEIHVSAALLDYLQALIDYSRESPEYQCGLSPRAGLALLTAAKAWAFMQDRDLVLPEDVQAVLPSVAGHRLRSGTTNSIAIVAPLLNNVAIP
jgi:MoxR-like ATPase